MDSGLLDRHFRYLQQLGHSAGSVYARRRALVRMAKAIGEPLADATREDLAAWRDRLTVTDDTVTHYVAHARGYFRWLVAQGYRADDPTGGLPVPRLSRRLPRPVGEEDLMRAVDSAPDRIRPWLVLAGWCGLRAKEIALLRRENILDTTLPPVLLIAADATKGTTERIVPLSPFVLEELYAAGLPGSGHAFRRHDGRPGPNKPWIISGLCNRHLHESGISETLHQLRHRFGTMTYRASLDLRLVQELMGHANPATTAGYAAYDKAAAAAAVNSLPVPRKGRCLRVVR
jgi:integrase